MSAGTTVKKWLYRNTSLERYLTIVSRLYFIAYGTGVLRFSAGYRYHYLVRRLIRKGDTVIDIGANLGYFSRIFSKAVGAGGRVYGVEPVKPIFDTLQRNLKGCGNVTIFNCALGDTEGTANMSNDTVSLDGYFGTGRNYVDTNGGAEPGMAFPTRLAKGSALFAGLEKIDLIKCDIEGYETVVLNEMLPLILRHRPVLLVETGGGNRPVIKKMFAGHGYCPFVAVGTGRMRPEKEGDTADIAFIPQERVADLHNLIVQ